VTIVVEVIAGWLVLSTIAGLVVGRAIWLAGDRCD
jgi:hypothetical protein